jgi:hypothetical protein
MSDFVKLLISSNYQVKEVYERFGKKFLSNSQTLSQVIAEIRAVYAANSEFL